MPLEDTFEEILSSGKPEDIRSLFVFDSTDCNDDVVMRFDLWCRHFFPQFFKFSDAPFHEDMDDNVLRVYRSEQTDFLNGAFRGAAKRQPLDAKVMTPNGWSTIGDISIGDYVIGSDGRRNSVIGLSPVVNDDIYIIETEDGRKTECDGGHLWTVRKMSNVKNKIVTIDVNEMVNDGYYYNRIDRRYNRNFKEYKFSIDTVGAIDYNIKDFDIEPYMLGVILGDGNIDKRYGGVRIHSHIGDMHHYRAQLADNNISDTKLDKRNNNVARIGVNGIGKHIVKLGLNVNCYNKFIPEEYLFGSIQQREALLEGLMDTDGTVSGRKDANISSFSTVSDKLADGVVSLVRSLGGKAVKRCNKGCAEFNGVKYYRISISFKDYRPFRLKRKLDNCNYATHTWSRIVNIEKVGKKDGRCIMTENNDGLYVTDDYLLTHNTTRTKLFVAFLISNDIDHSRKYFKVLSSDGANSRQIVTDLYNLLIGDDLKLCYPDIFRKTAEKRPERMSVFITATGVKVQADTVGTEQRGDIQEESRPDFIWFDDFETRKTLRSAVMTQSIWDNMEEARTGLAKDGGCIYNCNYVSERGNVHKLVEKLDNVLLTPIKGSIVNKAFVDGPPTWPSAYTAEEVAEVLRKADDPAGEYLCVPSAGADVMFDRACIDKQEHKTPIEEKAGFKIFHEFDPSHRYGAGADVGGGVSLDHSADVTIDFHTIPCKVVATFKSNTIKPDTYGDELKRHCDMFGEPIIAPENNKFDMTIGRLKQIYNNIYYTEDKQKDIEVKVPKTYGWNTNTATKPKMIYDLKKAVEDGHLELSDPDLITELRSYSRDDLMDKDDDVRLTTRHFDMLIACFVKGTMVLTDKGQVPIEDIGVGDMVMTRDGYKRVNKTLRHKKEVITNIGLTGTKDHPIICDNDEIKELIDVVDDDIIHIWNKEKEQIEKLSYTEARHIIDTQSQNLDNTGSIIVGVQNGKNLQHTFIDKYGLITLGQLLRDILYIIKMVTLITTISIILLCYRTVNILKDTWKTLIEKRCLGIILRRIAKKSTKESLIITRIRSLRLGIVRYVGKSSVLSCITRYIVPILARKREQTLKEELVNSIKSVKYAVRSLKQVCPTKRGVLKNVAKKEEESSIQTVYNLEVGGKHEYFANNVLVHNCAIAWQMKDHAKHSKNSRFDMEKFIKEELSTEKEKRYPEINI